MKRVDLSQDLAGLEGLADDDYAIAEGKSRELQMQECQLQLQTEGKQNALAMNPFKMDLILENLFPYCTVNTLKNCRLVSKQWRDASLKAWRDKSILCLGKDEEISSVITYVNLLHSNSTEDKPFQLEKYPFKNFRINQCSLEECLRGTEHEVSDMARHVILQNFIGKMVQIEDCILRSPSLKILELQNCDWSWGWEDGEVPFRASNMRHFKILQDIDPRSRRSRPWYAFFKRFGKLEALSIKYRAPKDCLTDIWRILREFDSTKTTEKDGKVARLKELELIHVPKTRLRYGTPPILSNGSIIASIRKFDFPLASLTLHLLCSEQDLDFKAGIHPIYRLLDSYKKTLQSLKTSFIFDGSEKSLQLHLKKKKNNAYVLRMEVLKEVQLSNGLWGLVILADLDLPNLKKLVVDAEECIEKMEDKQFYLSLPKERVFDSVETLEFLDRRKIPGPNTIKTLVKIMPNLAHLTMPLDKFTFEIVCENFKGLKSLNVLAAQCRYEELDDETLTGISPVKGPGETRKPNITDLANLQDLTIACERPDLPFPFTDHSVTYGFLQLPKLHTLSIRFKEISDENMAKLVNHVRGYVNVQVKPTSIPESYCDVEVDFDEPAADFLEMRVI